MTRSEILAVQRTELANERTLLAWLRTAVGVFGGGMALLHLLSTDVAVAAGWGLMVLAALITVIGVYRFSRMARLIRASQQSE